MSTTKNEARELDSAYRTLRAVLQEDLALGRRILSNCHAQRDALIENDHVRVAEIEAEGRLIAEQQEANGFRRDAAVRLLANACGAECADTGPLPRLTELAQSLPLQEARSLLSVRASILQVEQHPPLVHQERPVP